MARYLLEVTDSEDGKQVEVKLIYMQTEGGNTPTPAAYVVTGMTASPKENYIRGKALWNKMGDAIMEALTRGKSNDHATTH